MGRDKDLDGFLLILVLVWLAGFLRALLKNRDSA